MAQNFLLKKSSLNWSNLVKVLSVCLVLLVWHLVKSFIPEDTIPSPYSVFKKTLKLLASAEFYFHLSQTLTRSIISFLMALIVGLCLGILTAKRKIFEDFLSSFLIVGLSVPFIVLAIISIILFSASNLAAIMTCFLGATPLLIVNINQGIKTVDQKLTEMATVFKANKKLKFFYIYLPHLIPFLLLSGRNGFSIIFKIMVLSEALGLDNGIGYQIFYSFGIFSLKDVLAWTIAFILIMTILEYGVFRFLEERLTRWRTTKND